MPLNLKRRKPLLKKQLQKRLLRKRLLKRNKVTINSPILKKDIPVNLVQNVAIAIVLIDEGPDYKNWNVYLLNMRNEEIKTVIVNAKGYGEYQGKEVKT